MTPGLVIVVAFVQIAHASHHDHGPTRGQGPRGSLCGMPRAAGGGPRNDVAARLLLKQRQCPRVPARLLLNFSGGPVTGHAWPPAGSRAGTSVRRSHGAVPWRP